MIGALHGQIDALYGDLRDRSDPRSVIEIRFALLDTRAPRALGVEIDLARNVSVSPEAPEIQREGAPVVVLVIPTNEELEIAQETLACIRARIGGALRLHGFRLVLGRRPQRGPQPLDCSPIP